MWKPKARKTAVACESCRIHKRKCDGVCPVCGRCAKKKPKMACVFDIRRGEKTLCYIETLHSRIRQLEETGDRPAQSPLSYHEVASQLRPQPELTNLSSTGDAEPLSYQPWAPQTILQANAPRESTIASSDDNRATSPSGESHIENGNQKSPSTQSSDHLRDEQPLATSQVDAAMSTVDNVDTGEDGAPLESPEYFGSSSTYTFMSQVQNVLNTTHSWPNGGQSRGRTHDTHTATEYYPEESRGPLPYLQNHVLGGTTGGTNNWTNKTNSRFENFSLPPRRDADALLESYWTWMHNLYPFLDVASFTRRYDQLWSSSSHGRGNSLLSGSSQSETSWSTMSSATTSGTFTAMDKVLFHSILNMVFALGSQVNPSFDPDERWMYSDLFYQRAKRLIESDFDIMSQGSIPLVQTFLLMGQYLQSEEMSGACWNCIGIAVRAAQSIGLHLVVSEHIEPTNIRDRNTTVSHVEHEQFGLRRRLWGGCVMFDRVLSMVYGRPCMITPTLPMQPAHLFGKDCFDTSSLPEVDNSTHLTVFFIQALKLVDILGDISGTFYRGNDRHSAIEGRSRIEQHRQLNARDMATETSIIKIDDFHSLLKLDMSLTMWHEGLPDHLKVRSANPAEGGGEANKQKHSGSISHVISSQRNVLQARFLHARILLFRPLLLRSFSHYQCKAGSNKQGDVVSSDLQRALLGQASNICVSAAQDLIVIIADNMNSVSGMLPEWWNNIYHIYTCATVILVACLCPSIREGIERGSLKNSWNNCLSNLRAYQMRSRSARRCYRVLELIDQKVFCARPAAGTFSQNATSILTNASITTANAPSNMNGIADLQPGRAMPSVAADGVEGLSDSRPFFSNDELGLDNLRADWMCDPLDIEWLSSIPFDIDLLDVNVV